MIGSFSLTPLMEKWGSMEYDSVPVLHKLQKEQKRLGNIVKRQRASTASLPYPLHYKSKIDNSHLSGRLFGVEYAIDLILNGGKK